MHQPLPDGLVLRSVQAGRDVKRLIDFNSRIHSPTADPDPRIGELVRGMLAPSSHPTITPDDFFVVEDTANGEIVSSLCVIPQTWTYAGIPFGVGRPELVGTLPNYRRRGLVRTLFEAAHQRCAELNLPVQGITGIPYFYRQFGYEYALDLGGGAVVPLALLPETPESDCALCEVAAEDIPVLQALYNSAARGMLVTCPRPTEYWRYRLEMTNTNIEKQWLYRITRRGETIGYVDILKDTTGSRARVSELVLTGPAPEVIPWLLPRLRDEIAVLRADAPALESLYLILGRRHPIYPYLAAFHPVRQPPYAWYVRVADLAGFIRLIAPALEQRIAAGPLAGLTTVLSLDFYRDGLRLAFEEGRLTDATNLPPGTAGDASFPPLVFLQLLFGYRSVKSLTHTFPDVRLTPHSQPILDALFPRRLSWVRPLT